MVGYILLILFILPCLYLLYLLSNGVLKIIYRKFGGKECRLGKTRYKIQIPHQNKPKITYIVMAVIISYIAINWTNIENSLNYNFGAYWHGLGPSYSAVSMAVERKLLLEEPRKPTYYGIQPNYNRFCTQEEVLSEGSEFYGKCRILKSSAYDNRCGYYYFNAKCRSFKVSNQLWQNETIQKMILHAALNPCNFMVNPAYVRNVITGGTPAGVRSLWWNTGCGDAAGVNVVYFEIYEDEYFPDTDKHPYLAVYKAKK